MKTCLGGLIVLNFMALVHSETYPTCGDCWCIPGKNGLGPCPIWQPQTSFSNETITGYLNQVILNPYSLDCNPYYDADCTTTPTQDYLDLDTAICAFKYSDNSCGEYQLVTYPNRQEALKDRAVITHEGSCGLCSTATDLAVYLSKFHHCVSLSLLRLFVQIKISLKREKYVQPKVYLMRTRVWNATWSLV
jgi:hypothetical protein